jgi:hypothetical protein
MLVLIANKALSVVPPNYLEFINEDISEDKGEIEITTVMPPNENESSIATATVIV